MGVEERVRTARGEKLADVLLINCKLVNVLSGRVHPAEVAIAGGVSLRHDEEYYYPEGYPQKRQQANR